MGFFNSSAVSVFYGDNILDYAKCDYFDNELVLGWTPLSTLVAVIYPPKYHEAFNYLWNKESTPQYTSVSTEKMKESPDDFRDFTDRLYIPELKKPSNQNKIRNTPINKLYDYVIAMCTSDHEVHHIYQRSCSTVGWWFSINKMTQISNITWCLKKIKEAGISSIKIPLWKWGNQISLSNEKKIPEIAELADYVFRLNFLTGVLTGNVSVPIEGAIKELSEMFMNYQIPFNLSSSFPSNYPTSPYNLKLIDLIESETRCFKDNLTLTVWEMAGVPSNIIESIRNRMNFGSYVKAFDVFQRILGPHPPEKWIELFQIALHIAFFHLCSSLNTIKHMLIINGRMFNLVGDL